MRRRYNNTEQEQEAIAQEQDFLGDIGNFELPDIDLDLMEFLPSDETEKTRYTLPKVVPMREDFVLYDNAQKMARELRLGFGERFDAFVSGSFIFGDFIEAYLTTQNACAKRMTISTLSMSQNNVDSLHTLMEKGYIEELSKAEMKDLLTQIFGGETPTSVIDCDKPKKNPDHPTMKPVPLIGKLINNSSRRKDIVLDIFGGSGTTLIAAEQLGRCCRMVEFEPIYVDVIIKRWEEMTGMKAVLIRNILDPEQPADKPATKTKARKEG